MHRPGSTATDRDRTVADEEEMSTGRPSLARAMALGAKGGLVATVVMTVYRLPVFRALPPTAEFWAQYVGGGDAEEYAAEGLLLHLLYGCIGGTVFAIGFDRLGLGTPAARRRGGPLLGALYGLALSLFGERVVFGVLLDRELDEDEAVVFHVGHLVYGLTLGTWVSSQEAFGEVYD